jgi:Response regulator containing a CheY-like receiver domain and an HTH DNA-binding domain
LKILIVDDVPALRAHAKKVVLEVLDTQSPEFIEAANGTDGLRMAKELAPDLTLMDISMPEMNGVKAAEEIWLTNDKARIIFWSQYHREAYVRTLGKIVPDEAIHGYVLKGESDDKLGEAVRSVLLRGDPYIDPVVQSVQKRIQSKDASLTDYEYEALLDIAIGLTDRAIAARRHISVRGVQNRLSSLFSKVMKREDEHVKESAGVELFNPRIRTINEALKRGLIDPDDLAKLEEEMWSWLEDEYDFDRS